MFSTIIIILSTVITGPFPPPDRFYISSADFSLRELAFDWSSVSTECIRFSTISQHQIVAAALLCTTNYTTITYTDLSTNGNVCTFTIQTVACENIIGRLSYPIKVNTSIPNLLGMLHSDISRAYIILYDLSVHLQQL